MAALAVLAPEAASWTPGVRGSLRRSVARALAGSGVAASRLRRTRPAPAELRAWTRAPHPELGKREKEAQTRKPQYGKSLSKESFPSIHTLSMPGHRLGLRPSQPEAPAAQNWHQAGKVVAGPRVRALGARAYWPPGAGEAGGKDAGRPAAVSPRSPRPAPRTREAILRARSGAARWLRGHPGGHRAKGPPIPSSHSSSRAAHGSGTRVERSLPARPRQMPRYSLPRGLEERMAAVFLPTASRTLRRGCPVPGAAAAEPGCACRGCWGERRPDILWSQKTAKREAEAPVARVQSRKESL
ncbi:PREDICTED: uncharacterized protein LOC105544063 isoform X2 [Mandrillus leucophaeus]|uniref:uncharacterized protein LOC105544063 isoform X2 n=1 Tax=Mandrillus leucophaeus TaxID=9568 RepID=UPI0005F4A770|nr:PREDICTED: uncharacterized protein LOC105544063 isoform X2 [Mandrillus leucophaeus]